MHGHGGSRNNGSPACGADSASFGRPLRTILLSLLVSLLVFLLLVVGSFGLLLVALVTGMAIWAWTMAVLAVIVLVGALVRFVVTVVRTMSLSVGRWPAMIRRIRCALCSSGGVCCV